ncbi:hypothetical protein [Parasphingopyxis sp.]|uniref:hypothetical protein n=1 Tax=Parasphingopyxis sp. TaxID=1920299 RepID=UPI003FA0E983
MKMIRGIHRIARQVHGYSVAPEPVERGAQRRRYALDENDGMAGAGCGCATDLMFEEAAAGHRQQGTQTRFTLFGFLIGSDQRRKGHDMRSKTI